MWEVHHEVARRLLLGQKASHIAEDLGVSEAMVSYVRNSRVVQEKLDTMSAARDAETVDIAKDIREKAPAALRLLEKIIQGEIDAPITSRAREANNWLDRAGFGAVRRVEGQFTTAHFTADDIETIKRRAIENGFAKPSKLVNVTPVASNGDN
jgi:predicted transcriptional regulator